MLAPLALVLMLAPRTPCICSFALVLADARPPALLACAPDALVLADARPPHSLHLLLPPLALVLADARAPGLRPLRPQVRWARVALLAYAPDALVLADARPPHSSYLLLAPLALLLAETRAPALLAPSFEVPGTRVSKKRHPPLSPHE